MEAVELVWKESLSSIAIFGISGRPPYSQETQKESSLDLVKLILIFKSN